MHTGTNPPHASHLQHSSGGSPAAHACSVSAPVYGEGGTPAIQSLGDNTVDHDGAISEESFMDTFIASTRDVYDNVLSVVWYLSPISFTDPFKGARVVNQYSSDTRAFGIILELVKQDDTHALYRLRIEGWFVHGGSYKPPCDMYAFLLVPAKYPNTHTSQHPTSFWRSHRGGRLIHTIHDIAQEAKTLALYGNPMVLMGPDTVANAFALSYSECPLMRSFSSDKDAGVAVYEHDLMLAIGHHAAAPMANGDCRAIEANHLADSAYSGGGDDWEKNGYGQYNGEVSDEGMSSQQPYDCYTIHSCAGMDLYVDYTDSHLS